MVEQQQGSLDTIDDNATKDVDELSTSIEHLADATDAAVLKAKGTSNKRAMAAAAVGVVGGIARGSYR